jgi:hypothetical protein
MEKVLTFVFEIEKIVAGYNATGMVFILIHIVIKFMS